MWLSFGHIRQVGLQQRCLLHALTGANHIAQREQVERASINQSH